MSEGIQIPFRNTVAASGGKCLNLKADHLPIKLVQVLASEVSVKQCIGRVEN